MTLLINGEPVPATQFAWDGCHKVYLIFNDEDREKMIANGYELDVEILPVSELPSVWECTCSLRFISRADLQGDDLIRQFEDGTVEYIER